MMRLIRLAEQINQRAHDVKSYPAHVEPVEARRRASHEKVQNQVRPDAHQEAREGDKLEAVEG